MALARGTRLGAYEVVALLGAGGMGEVYRAHDSRLRRDVALKILPDSFSADANRLARFAREAQLLAALNHVNIGGIYGLEDGALVLELIEGPTLAERIAQGPLRLGEALGIAAQIASGLEAAHDRGIVHRDLKPGNIKLSPDGAVKVLDFGLAKETGSEGEPSDATTIANTEAGAIFGTVAYMSPEQARGQRVDKRVDIWAFGCVVYEMIVGRPAFGRETASETFAALLEREPDWSALPADTPQALRQLLRRCLEKDARRRLRDIGDARIAIEDLLANPELGAGVEHPSADRARPTRVIALVGVLSGAVLAAIAVLAYLNQREPAAPALRLSIYTPGQISPQLSGIVSPDGQRVAFVSTDTSGQSTLWIRSLDALNARALQGTENAAHPFWSPDSRWLGFVAEGKLKRVAHDGGAVQTIADTAFRSGASWGSEGTVVFSPHLGELARVSAAGGPVTLLLEPDNTTPVASWPSFFPDGRHFLFFGRAGTDGDGIYVAALDAPKPKLVLRNAYKGAYAEPGYLLYPRGSSLFAQRFDAKSLVVNGDPVLIADGVWSAATAAHGAFSVSTTGLLAYVNATLWNNQLVWYDRHGKSLGTFGQAGRFRGRLPDLSPDAQHVVFADGGTWQMDEGGGMTRLTFDPDDTSPLWSSDGRQILFASPNRSAAATPNERAARLVRKSLDGRAVDEASFDVGSIFTIEDWTADGRFLVYTRLIDGQTDLWVLPLSDDRQPFSFASTPFTEAQPQVSPNGQWIAYTSNQSGGDEVHIQRFPGGGEQKQVSAAGGVQPRWRHDGKELFYLAGNQNLMAVPVTTEPTFTVGRGTPLFRTRLVAQGSQSVGFATMYDVTADGQRFLLNVLPDDPGPTITIVSNWPAMLKQ
jgi:Tol biopolymer transport system component